MATQAPLFVEFVGLPGAGKTALLKELASRHVEAGGEGRIWQDKKNRWRKLSRLPFFALNDRQFFAQAVRYTGHVRPLNRASFRYLLSLLTIRMITSPARLPGSDVIVLDQCLLQTVWSILMTGTPPAETYLRRLFISAYQNIRLAVVFLDTDVHVAIGRIRNRPAVHSRFDRMSTDTMRSVLGQRQHLLGEIVECCASSLNIPVLRLNATRPIDANAGIVHDWVAGMMEPSSLSMTFVFLSTLAQTKSQRAGQQIIIPS